MNPRLTDDEQALRHRAQVAAVPIAARAADIDTDRQTSRELLTELGAAGILGACLPASYGGGGGGRLEMALVCEELGAASASVAVIVASHMVAASLLESAGDTPEKDRLLPKLASGEMVAALVLDGSGSLLDEPAVAAVVSGAEGSMTVSGTAAAVAAARQADVLVVPASGADADGGLHVAVIETDAEGVGIGEETPKLGLNGSGLASVNFEKAPLGEGQLISGAQVEAALEAARDAARIANSGVSIGIARAALEASTRHAKSAADGLDRSQAVQWMLADTATESEAARLLTWYAASREKADELRETAAMARLLAAEAAVAATRRAVQVLGAGGNERSAGVERLYRDAKAMEIHHGAAESQRTAVARQLLPDLF